MRRFSIRIFLLLCFIVISIMEMLHHDVWYDEYVFWLMAKESHSIHDLTSSFHYTGHPLLWNLMLYGITRFTSNPVYMQMLNVFISCFAAALFVFYAPFNLFEKICILFSYFFLFEYTLISRNYALCWFLLTLFCVLFFKKYYLLITLVLILLANTHLFAFVISINLFLITLYKYKLDKGKFNGTLLVYCLLFGMGLLITILTVIPPQDTIALKAFHDPLFTWDRFSKSTSFFVKGMYPLPVLNSIHFWNSNFLVTNMKLFAFVLTALILLLPFFILEGKLIPFFFFYACIIPIIILMFYLKLFSGTRYMGFCFIILLLALWLAHDKDIAEHIFWNPWLENINRFVFKPLMGSIFIVQLIAGLYACSLALHYPFSEGRNAAAYINGNIPAESNVIIEPGSDGLAVAAYLKRNPFYPDMNEYAPYYSWNSQITFNKDTLFRRIKSNMNADASQYQAIVLSLAMDSINQLRYKVENDIDSTKFRLFAKTDFKQGIVKAGNYIVYLFKRN